MFRSRFIVAILLFVAVLSLPQFAKANNIPVFSINPGPYTVTPGGSFTLTGSLTTPFADRVGPYPDNPNVFLFRIFGTTVEPAEPLLGVTAGWDAAWYQGVARMEIQGAGFLGPNLTSFQGPGTYNFDIRTLTVPTDAIPGTYQYWAGFEFLDFVPGSPGNPLDTITPELTPGCRCWTLPGGSFEVQVVPAPEPSSVSLLFGGIAALMFVPFMPLRRRKA